MKGQTLLVSLCAVLFAIPAFGRDKKNDRAMIEKMEAVPCGAKERGVSGIGSVFASIGATRMDSDEKLCPQYMLRTDDMEFHVRPLDHKHPRILPIGKEAEYKISKDVMEMRIPDGDHKRRRYQVVSMKPIDHSESSEPQPSGAKYNPPVRDRDYADKSLADKTTSTVTPSAKAPVPPPPPPQ